MTSPAVLPDRPLLAGALTALYRVQRAPGQVSLRHWLVGSRNRLSSIEIQARYAETAAQMALQFETVAAAPMLLEHCGDGYRIGHSALVDELTGARYFALLAPNDRICGLAGDRGLYLTPPHRGRRLGAVLSMYARLLDGDAEYGPTLYSPAGLRTVLAAYRLAVQQQQALGLQTVPMADVDQEIRNCQERLGLSVAPPAEAPSHG